MIDVLKIFNEIKSISSRGIKEEILKKNKNNQLLENVLKFVFNPYIVTGVSKKKINKKVNNTSNLSIPIISNIVKMMDYLKENNTGKYLDILAIQNFIKLAPKELQELYTQIATKSLKIGITAKTLNKIYGKGFIPEFNVMLANKYFDRIEKVKGEFIITTKLDGGRSVIIKDNGKIKIFTRQGQSIEDLVEIEEEAKLLPDNMVYDGELLLRNDKGLKSKDLYRATMKETRKDGIKKNLIFNCFDILPLEDFKNGICKKPCKDRKSELHEIMKNLKLKHIIEVPILYIGKDQNTVSELLEKARNNDEEGVMVNISNAPYECKRSNNLLKVKVMQSADLKIIGFEKGDGKFSNTLGKIIVNYKGYKVGCGSGFTDEDREYIWNNQDKLLGRIAEIQYFEETKNQNGGISIRFPVFKSIREEGKEVSYK
ncbi:RNA ligase family protein [Clostridium rectalis]|uniref:ATP-dependent DNA ligase n=1 Tax=Clostridium rectalis TaxID=2040295 RepID=UPI000F637511|nr:RNA ligase family protein [Clostridium rectalis]